MELIKVIKEYVQATHGNFPGNYYWSRKFENAYDADKENIPHERVVIQKIAEKIRKAKILKETKNYTYDLGNAERLRGYIKALEELKHELSDFTV